MATRSSISAWRIPWTEEPGGQQSMGSQRVRHNLVTNTLASSPLLPTSSEDIPGEDAPPRFMEFCRQGFLDHVVGHRAPDSTTLHPLWSCTFPRTLSTIQNYISLSSATHTGTDSDGSRRDTCVSFSPEPAVPRAMPGTKQGPHKSLLNEFLEGR